MSAHVCVLQLFVPASACRQTRLAQGARTGAPKHARNTQGIIEVHMEEGLCAH